MGPGLVSEEDRAGNDDDDDDDDSRPASVSVCAADALDLDVDAALRMFSGSGDGANPPELWLWRPCIAWARGIDDVDDEGSWLVKVWAGRGRRRIAQ